MALVKMEHSVVKVSDKNGKEGFVISVKLGNREPYFYTRCGTYLIFDTEVEAKEYIDDM